MSDPIDRTQLLSAFNDWCCANCKQMSITCAGCKFNNAIDIVDDMPDAVVRCKDCHYFYDSGYSEGLGYCIIWHGTTYSNGYCHNGERKEDTK